MLPGGEEGRTGEEIRIPQGQFAAAQRVGDEPLPRVVFEQEVERQIVVRRFGREGIELIANRSPRLEEEQVVCRDECAIPKRHRPEEDEGQEEESESGEEVGAEARHVQ